MNKYKNQNDVTLRNRASTFPDNSFEQVTFTVSNQGLQNRLEENDRLFVSSDKLAGNTAKRAVWGDVLSTLKQYPVGYTGNDPEFLEPTRRAYQNDEVLLLKTDGGAVGVKKSDEFAGDKTRKQKFYIYDQAVFDQGRGVTYYFENIGYFDYDALRDCIERNEETPNLPKTVFDNNGNPVGAVADPEELPVSSQNIDALSAASQL